MNDLKNHWEKVYAEREPDEYSWYQLRPEISVELIQASGITADQPLIDIGGGASTLVDHLLADDHEDITVLDLSETAVRRAQQRLGPAAERVSWLVADITEFRPERQYALWHDRAVLHFMTAKEGRDAYLGSLNRALAPGGHMVVATFSPDGPDKCSGLPIVQYTREQMQELLGDGYQFLQHRQEAHSTPVGKVQHFNYFLFQRI